MGSDSCHFGIKMQDVCVRRERERQVEDYLYTHRPSDLSVYPGGLRILSGGRLRTWNLTCAISRPILQPVLLGIKTYIHPLIIQAIDTLRKSTRQ
jgi:hypothetical protein